MPTNVTVIPGADQIDFYLGNYTYAAITADMEILKIKLATDLNRLVYKNAAGTSYKILTDASTTTNAPINGIFFANSVGAAITSSLFIYDISTGRLGVAIASPDSRLHVNGTIESIGGFNDNVYYSSGWKYSGNGVGYSLYGAGTTLARLSVFANNSGGHGAAATETIAMSLNVSNGYVAIGDVTPLAHLHVGAGADAFTQAISPAAHVYITGAGHSMLTIRDATNNIECGLFTFSSDSTVNFGTWTNHPLIMRTNNVEAGRISTGGYLGLGATTVDRHLHIETEDAAESTVLYQMRLSHWGSGTIYAAFGVGIEFEIDSGSCPGYKIGQLDYTGNGFVMNDSLNVNGYFKGYHDTYNIFEVVSKSSTETQLRITADAGSDCLIDFYETTTAKQRILWDSSQSALRVGTENTTIKIGGGSSSIGFYGDSGATRAAFIADPAGGGTVDAEARSAIKAILDILDGVNLMAPS